MQIQKYITVKCKYQVTEQTWKEGVLIDIVGCDMSAHAVVMTEDGKILDMSVNRVVITNPKEIIQNL